MEHDSGTERCPGFVTALVLRCGQGDRAALLTLMDLVHAPVRARVAAGRSGDEADALVSRAFVRIWQRAPAFEPQRGPGPVAWLLSEAAAVRDTEQTLVPS